MAGIYTDSYAALILHHINYLRKVLESIAHIAALTGSILYHCSNSLCLLKRYVYGVCNYSQALIFAYHIQVAARVKIEPVQPKLPAAAHLLYEGLSGFGKPILFGAAQVNKVAVVRQNLRRGEAVCGTILLKLCYVALCKRLGNPLALVLCKERKCCCSNLLCIKWRIVYSSRCAYVCSKIFHISSLFIFLFPIICLFPIILFILV